MIKKTRRKLNKLKLKLKGKKLLQRKTIPKKVNNNNKSYNKIKKKKKKVKARSQL